MSDAAQIGIVTGGLLLALGAGAAAMRWLRHTEPMQHDPDECGCDDCAPWRALLELASADCGCWKLPRREQLVETLEAPQGDGDE